MFKNATIKDEEDFNWSLWSPIRNTVLEKMKTSKTKNDEFEKQKKRTVPWLHNSSTLQTKSLAQPIRFDCKTDTLY